MAYTKIKFEFSNLKPIIKFVKVESGINKSTNIKSHLTPTYHHKIDYIYKLYVFGKKFIKKLAGMFRPASFKKKFNLFMNDL